MVLLLLSSLWMTLVPLTFGSWLLGRLRRWAGAHFSAEQDVSLLVTWWLGLALLTALLETWALVGPLRGPVFAVVAGLAGAFAGFDRANWRRVVGQARALAAGWHPLAWAIWGGVGAILLALTTLPPNGGDTGLYHAPFIRWMEETGTVPGLANLDVHLGYNSSWLATQVLSTWGQWLGSPLQGLMSLVLFMFTGYALAPLAQRAGGPAPATALFRLLLGLVALFWYGESMLGLGSDAAAGVLAFTVLSQAAELGLPGRERPLRLGHLAVVLLVVYAVTIKFSVVPLALVPLVWLWGWRAPATGPGKAGLVVWLAAVGLGLGLPWVLTTAELTGYLLFPFAGLDVLPVDWKYPHAALVDHVSYIRNFARNPALPQYNVYGQPISYWLPIWWQQQIFYDKYATFATPVLALLAGGLVVFRRSWRAPQASGWALVLGTTGVGTVFWFSAAPAYRFGYPFTLPLFCLLLVPLLGALSGRLRLNLRPALAVGMFAALLSAAILTELRSFGVPRIFTPAQYANVLAHIPAGPSRTFIAGCYQPDTTGHYTLRVFLPGSVKVKLVGTLALHGQLQQDGLMATGRRWLLPAPYPVNPFQRRKIGNVTFMWLPPKVDYGFWYAPFPATNNPSIYLRTGELRGGFRAYPLPATVGSQTARP